MPFPPEPPYTRADLQVLDEYHFFVVGDGPEWMMGPEREEIDKVATDDPTE